MTKVCNLTWNLQYYLAPNISLYELQKYSDDNLDPAILTVSEWKTFTKYTDNYHQRANLEQVINIISIYTWSSYNLGLTLICPPDQVGMAPGPQFEW